MKSVRTISAAGHILTVATMYIELTIVIRVVNFVEYKKRRAFAKLYLSLIFDILRYNLIFVSQGLLI